MQIGVITLKRFNGEEQFPLSESIVYKKMDGDKISLVFEIDAIARPLKTLPDTKDFGAQPNAEFIVKTNNFSWDKLVGRIFTIPFGFNEKTNEYLTRFYYFEHSTTDDNVIEILEKRGDFIHVVIKGTCVDVNYYDGSKPRTVIEINAFFQIKS